MVSKPSKRTDATSSDAEASVLTVAKASELCPKPFRLVAKAEGFATMDDLSSLQEVDYIDIRDNSFSSLHGISQIQRLKTVIAKGNSLNSVHDLAALSNIRVLNLSENKLSSIDSIAKSTFAAELVTLVLSGNQLTDIDEISAFPNLRVLVVSNNKIESLSPASCLSELQKLSASRNAVRSVPLALSKLGSLEEFRLAHNKLTKLPAKEVLAGWSSLRIIDVGHNEIADICALSSLGDRLVAANFAGNPVAAQDAKIYRKLVLGACPRIEIIDGIRLQGGRKKVRLARKLREETAKQQNKHGMENEADKECLEVAEDKNGSAVKPVELVGKTGGSKRKAKLDEHEQHRAPVEKVTGNDQPSEKKLRKKRKLATTDQNANRNDKPLDALMSKNIDTSASEKTMKEKKKRRKKSENSENVVRTTELPKLRNAVDENDNEKYPIDDDDDALDSAEFLKRGKISKTNTETVLSLHLDEEKRTQGVEKKQKGKKIRKNRKSRTSVKFGGGGESQWD